MSQDILNLNEESFEQIVTVLSQYSVSVKECYDTLAKSITDLSTEWDDEDHQEFLNAIKSVAPKIDTIDESTQQLISEAEYKIEMIRARKSIKF